MTFSQHSAKFGPRRLSPAGDGKLSEIVASDGKVFLSITVDAAAVQAWEAVRERAEAAIRAVPGVKSVMVALTAERSPGGPSILPRKRRSEGTGPAAAAAGGAARRACP